MRVALAFLLVVTCVAQATVQTESKTPPANAATGSSKVKDVRIEIALFGSGSHLVDVTDRVVELLRSKPEGFTAKSEWLNVDPAPGKNKSLLIRYRYHDQEHNFLITGGNRVSYSALIGREDEV